MHVANRFGGGTHITGPQLSDAIVSVGLSMTKSEVEILCSGPYTLIEGDHMSCIITLHCIHSFVRIR